MILIITTFLGGFLLPKSLNNGRHNPIKTLTESGFFDTVKLL